MDERDIKIFINFLINSNPQYARAAKEKVSLRGWFVGQVQKHFRGEADNLFVINQIDYSLENMV